MAELFEPEDLCVEGLEPGGPPRIAEPGFRMVALAGRLEDSLAVFTSSAELDEALGEWVDSSLVDFGAALVVAFWAESGACPPIVADVVVEGLTARLVTDGPGYGSCEDVGGSRTYVVSIDHSRLPAGGVTVVHPDGTRSVGVDVPGATPPEEVEPTVEDLATVRGTFGLPGPGEVTPELLDDGTPVFVVHHLDGSVTVIDARAARPEDEDGLRLVSFATRSRRFMGIGSTDAWGAWDEYGRSLDRGPAHDLTRFVAEVDGDAVVVGQEPQVRPPGDPITGEIFDLGGRRIVAALPQVMSVSEALQRPDGTVVVVEALVVALPGGEHFACEWTEEAFRNGCPEGSPPVIGLDPPTFHNDQLDGYHLVRVDDGVFSEFTDTGRAFPWVERFPR